MEEVFRHFPFLEEVQKKQFNSLIPLYEEWNTKINVLSRKESTLEWKIRHVLHSLSIGLFVNFKPGANVMDVGTGGGFPGIPLAILFPQTEFYLVDSIGKKIKVVQAIAKDLGLKNVVAEQKRAEEVNQKFDFVVSRAVTDFSELYSWIRNSIKSKSIHPIKNGLICLKGGDLEEELKDFSSNKGFENIAISNFFEYNFFETKRIVYTPITL